MLRNVLVVIVFGMAALVGIWDLLQIEAFDNAVMQFATAGVVPGTGVVLSPGQVYVVLCAILLLAICALFYRSLARDLRELGSAFARAGRRKPPRAAVVPEQPVAPTPAASPATAAVLASPVPTPASRPAVIITIPATPGVLAVKARSFTAWLKPAASQWGCSVIRRGRQDARYIAAASRKYGRMAWRQSVCAWRYTEPHIRELDAYIEQTLKRNPKAARALREADRMYQAAAVRAVQWRAKHQRSVEK